MLVWYGGVTYSVAFVQCVFGVKPLSGVLVQHGGRVEFIQGGIRVLMGWARVYCELVAQPCPLFKTWEFCMMVVVVYFF
jgi:hypothetical protein